MSNQEMRDILKNLFNELKTTEEDTNYIFELREINNGELFEIIVKFKFADRDLYIIEFNCKHNNKNYYNVHDIVKDNIHEMGEEEVIDCFCY